MVRDQTQILLFWFDAGLRCRGAYVDQHGKWAPLRRNILPDGAIVGRLESTIGYRSAAFLSFESSSSISFGASIDLSFELSPSLAPIVPWSRYVSGPLVAYLCLFPVNRSRLVSKHFYLLCLSN